jgi:hypothetical protein
MQTGLSARFGIAIKRSVASPYLELTMEAIHQFIAHGERYSAELVAEVLVATVVFCFNRLLR